MFRRHLLWKFILTAPMRPAHPLTPTPRRPRFFRRSRGQLGLGKLTMLVFGLLLAAILYSGYQIIPFFYSYFEMHNQMTAIIPKAYLLKDAEIRRRIMGFIKELEIPADSKQLLIDRRDGKMRLRLSYEEVFYFPWGEEDIEIYVFPFAIDVEGAY